MYSVTSGKVDGSSCGLTGAGGVVGSIILILHEIAVRTNHSRWALERNATRISSDPFDPLPSSVGIQASSSLCPGALCPSHPAWSACLWLRGRGGAQRH